MHYQYRTQGVCSRAVDFDLENGVVNNVKFTGGCPGNTLGVAALANGRSAQELIGIIKGIRCGYKPTSCPDQLALAIEAAMAREANQ